MPWPCADVALALMRFKLTGRLTLPDIRDNIIAVADKDAQTVVTQGQYQPNLPLAILLTACPLVALRQSVFQRF